MFSENSKVSGRQLGRMIFVAASGTTAYLSLNIFSRYGSDGLLMMIWVYLYALIYSMGCFKWAEYMGKWQSKKIYRILRALAMIMLLSKYLCISAIVINAMSDMVRLILIPNVSPFIILVVTLLCLIYCVKGGIESRGRACEILFYFVFIPIVIICTMLVPKVEISGIIPTFDINLKKAVIDFFIIVWLFVPAELLVLAKDSYDNTASVRGNVYAAISLTAIVNIAIYAVALGVYGDITVQQMDRPVLRLMQIGGIPGDFLNRQDGIMSVFLVVSMFVCAWALIYHINELVKVLFTQNKGKKAIKITTTAVVIIVALLFIVQGKNKEKIIAADVGGMDLEERQFVMSVIVVGNEADLDFYFEIAASERGSSEEGSVNVKSKFEKVEAKNLSEAEEKISFKSGGYIDYSHMKVVLVDKELFDKLETIKMLATQMSEDMDFGENIVVCAIEMDDEISEGKEYGKSIEAITKRQKAFSESEVFRFDKMYSLNKGSVTIPLIDVDVKLIGSGTVSVDMVEWEESSGE